LVHMWSIWAVLGDLLRCVGMGRLRAGTGQERAQPCVGGRLGGLAGRVQRDHLAGLTRL